MYSSVALTHTHTWLSLKALCEVVLREEESQIWKERETRKLLNIVCIKTCNIGLYYNWTAIVILVFVSACEL